jgi:hypothetical protein
VSACTGTQVNTLVELANGVAFCILAGMLRGIRFPLARLNINAKTEL